MLILSRKPSESIVINGRIIVKIVRVEGEIVKVGIEAPSDIPIFRQEVYNEIQLNNREALTRGRPRMPLIKPPGVSVVPAPKSKDALAPTDRNPIPTR